MKPVPKELSQGEVIKGRYEIESVVGIQETGTLYLCRDLEAGKALGRIRIFNADISRSESVIGLAREMSFIHRLRHPNLVRILDFGALEDYEALFLIEEWFEGQDLYSGTEGMNPEDVLRLILELSQALRFLHTRGLIHGNLNHTNAVLAGLGSVQSIKLTGFGTMHRLAKQLRRSGSGSLAYMAPEVLSEGVVTESSDLYSLGVMIYQLLIRRLPFEDEDPGFLIQKHLQGTVDLRPVERLRFGTGLSGTICGLMDKDPSKRPSINEVVGQIAAELPIEGLGGRFTGELERCLSISQFVGREEEMLFLRDCAAKVRANSRGWTVFIAGEAGSGKTRCLEELKSWALLEGWQIVEGGCGTHEEGAYGPFRQILAKTKSADGEPLFQFSDIPRVAESGSFDASSEFAAGQFRDLLTRELVRRLSGRPTLLLLHDFHLSDEATNAVLDYLSSDIQSHPILMCVSFRSAEETKSTLSRVMDMVVRQQRGQIVRLPPLTREDVGQLIAGMTGDHRLKETLGPWMFESIGGNPYFLEEMLKHLVEQRLLVFGENEWHFIAQDLFKLEIPDSLSAVLRRRLLQLSPEAGELANWLALFRRTVTVQLLGLVASWPPERILQFLEELNNRQLIRVGAQNAEKEVEFCHSLIAEVIRGDLANKVRRKMHLRIAQTLEREYGVECHLQEIALHYMESGLTAKAVENAFAAASECKREHSNENALQFYEYIIAKRKSCPSAMLDDVLLDATDCCCAIGIPKRGIEILSGCFKVENLKPIKKRARFLFQMAQAYRHVGDSEKIEMYANSALSLLKRSGGPKERNLRAALLTHLAYCHLIKSQPNHGLQLLAKALSTIPSKISPAAGQIYSVISALKRVSCDLRPAMKAARESIWILGPLQHHHMLAVAHSHLGVCLVSLGRFNMALEQHRKAVEISEQTRSLSIRAQAMSNLAECLCRQGNLIEARSASEKAVQLSIECGNPAIKHSSLAILAEIEVSSGEYERADKILKDLDHDENPFVAIFSRAHVSYLLAWLHFELGQFDESKEYIQKVQEIQKIGAPVYEYEMAEAIDALIMFFRGKKESAIQRLQDLKRSVLKKRWPFQACLILLYLGECLISNSNLLGAWQAVRDAARLAKGMNSNLLMARAHLLMGRLLFLYASHDSVFLTNSVKPKIEKAIALCNHGGALDLLWRAHYELSKIEQSLSNWENSLHHISETMKLISSRKAQVPKASVSGVSMAALNSSKVFWECEKRRNLIQRRTKTPAPEDTDHQVRTLFRFSRIIGSIRDLDLLVDSISEQLIQAIGVKRALIFLEDRSTGRLIQFGSTKSVQSANTLKQDVRRDILDDVFNNEMPFVSANAKRDPRISNRTYAANESETILCAPLKVTDHVMGVLYADDSSPAVSIGESVISLFAAFCNLAAMAIDNALVHQQVVKEKSELEQYLHCARDGYEEIVGKSLVIEQLRDRIGFAAASPLDILITGESGTGKELVAEAIYRTGRRKSGKLIPVDCGSLSDSLAEAELFGYRKGAFTGAIENRQGLLEAAQGGTVFLDEIANLPFRLQAKFLRVLQEREVRRIGETTPRKIDLQVIAATNKDLFDEINKGNFRSDLYYRLKMMEIRVPALRNRPDDIPLLIEFFLQELARAEGRNKKLSMNARKVLQEYRYPGNIRELKNIIAEAYYSAKGLIIDLSELPEGISRPRNFEYNAENELGDRLYNEIIGGRGDFEDIVRLPFCSRQFGAPVVRKVIERALLQTKGRYREAFSLLKIPEKRYSVCIQFLKRNKCYIDFRPFRKKYSTPVIE